MRVPSIGIPSTAEIRARYALTTVRNVELGPVGIWTHHLDMQPWAEARVTLQEIEDLGYSAVWIPEAVTRDAIVASTLALEASTKLILATGIVPLYPRRDDGQRRPGARSKRRSREGSSSASA